LGGVLQLEQVQCATDQPINGFTMRKSNEAKVCNSHWLLDNAYVPPTFRDSLATSNFRDGELRSF